MRLGPIAVLLFFICIGPLAAQDRQQVVSLPGPGGSTLVATVMRPPGEARSPLVVINHGSPADSSQRFKMERPRFTALSSWFLSRGYVVALPLRRGYGETGGDWAEGYGLCDAPDYYRAGLQGAADIQATIDFMRAQPYVAPRPYHRGRSVGRRLGDHRPVESQPAGRSGHDQLRRRARRTSEAGGRRYRQLHASSAGRRRRQIRRDRPGPDALDLCRERQLLRAVSRQANGRGL